MIKMLMDLHKSMLTAMSAYVAVSLFGHVTSHYQTIYSSPAKQVMNLVADLLIVVNIHVFAVYFLMINPQHIVSNCSSNAIFFIHSSFCPTDWCQSHPSNAHYSQGFMDTALCGITKWWTSGVQGQLVVINDSCKIWDLKVLKFGRIFFFPKMWKYKYS